MATPLCRRITACMGVYGEQSTGVLSQLRWCIHGADGMPLRQFKVHSCTSEPRNVLDGNWTKNYYKDSDLYLSI